MGTIFWILGEENVVQKHYWTMQLTTSSGGARHVGIEHVWYILDVLHDMQP